MIRFFSIAVVLFNIFLLGTDKQVETKDDLQYSCERSYPEADTTKYKVTISKLNALKENIDCITVEGFIYGIYKCPPCPEGATCKPCASPQFYIHTDKEEDINIKTGRRYRISETTIYAENTCQLQLNKRYVFSIERKVKEYPVKNLSLIHI